MALKAGQAVVEQEACFEEEVEAALADAVVSDWLALSDVAGCAHDGDDDGAYAAAAGLAMIYAFPLCPCSLRLDVGGVKMKKGSVFGHLEDVSSADQGQWAEPAKICAVANVGLMLSLRKDAYCADMTCWTKFAS